MSMLVTHGLLSDRLLTRGLYGGSSATYRNLLVALRAYLKGVSALSALSEVYLNRVARNPVYPYLVVNRLYSPKVFTTSEAYHEKVMLQFTVLAVGTATVRGDEQAETLGLAAWHALTPKAANPVLLFSDGAQIVRIPGPDRGPDEQANAGPNGSSVWKYSFDYTFLVAREM